MKNLNVAATTDLTTKNLIQALQCYAIANSWTDSDFISALLDMGITEKDFINCGYDGEYFANYS